MSDPIVARRGPSGSLVPCLEACRLCGQHALEEFTNFPKLRRATSDCRPWSAGGRLALCRSCGAVQKPEDEQIAAEIEQIYASYALYHQGGGSEQAVFSDTGHALPRSARLVEALRQHAALPSQGRMLDIGCGNGGNLKSFGKMFPGWTMVGTELDERHRHHIESIPGVEGFFTCLPGEIPGDFDLVMMLHVLEHLVQPGEFLHMAWAKLVRGGLLVIDLPDHTCNPFDLIIADHYSHFDAGLAARWIQQTLHTDAKIVGDWLPKELILLVRKDGSASAPGGETGSHTARELVENQLLWLFKVREQARCIRQASGLGVFGTSIAAAWLFGELEGAVDFFVDEDLNRVGRSFQGRPIYAPRDVPAGSHVFLALLPKTAKAIEPRVRRQGVVYHLPPEL